MKRLTRKEWRLIWYFALIVLVGMEFEGELWWPLKAVAAAILMGLAITDKANE